MLLLENTYDDDDDDVWKGVFKSSSTSQMYCVSALTEKGK